MEDLQKEYQRIQKYAGEADTGNYDLSYKEVVSIIECSQNVYDIACLAFGFGFAKGCRKTKKAVTA